MDRRGFLGSILAACAAVFGVRADAPPKEQVEFWRVLSVDGPYVHMVRIAGGKVGTEGRLTVEHSGMIVPGTMLVVAVGIVEP